MAEVIIDLMLPEPPSANRYYRRGFKGAPHESSEAKVYKQAVNMLTSRHRINGELPFPSGDLGLIVIWYRSAKRGDLSNRLKILEDALQGSVYADDNQIAYIIAHRCDEHASVPKGFMAVTVSRVEPLVIAPEGSALTGSPTRVRQTKSRRSPAARPKPGRTVIPVPPNGLQQTMLRPTVK